MRMPKSAIVALSGSSGSDPRPGLRIGLDDAAVHRRAAAEVVLRRQPIGVGAIEHLERRRAVGAQHLAVEGADREGVEAEGGAEEQVVGVGIAHDRRVGGKLDVGQAERKALVLALEPHRPLLAVRNPRADRLAYHGRVRRPVAVEIDEDRLGILEDGEAVEPVVADAGAPAAATEVAGVARSDADVREVAVARQRNPEARDVEVVAQRRAGERVRGEMRRVVVAEAAAVRDEPRLVEVGEAGQREVARHVAHPLLVGAVGVAEGERAPVPRDEDAACGLAVLGALPTQSIVRANGGAEGDSAVGRSGHVHAEPDPGDGAQVVGEVAVRVGLPDRAVVVDVVPEPQAGVAEQHDPLRRGDPARQHAATGHRREQRSSHPSLRPAASSLPGAGKRCGEYGTVARPERGRRWRV